MTLAAIRERCAALYHELATEYYRAGAGLQEGLNSAAILDRYADLAALPQLRLVEAAWQSAGNDLERRRLGLLREHLAWLYDAHAGRELNDRLHHLEATATVSIDGAPVPYRSLQGMLVNEASRARRLQLAELRAGALEQFVPTHLEWFAEVQRISGELGYDDHIARCADLGDLPLASLRPLCVELLERTAGPYEAALGTLLAAAGIPRDEAHSSDLAHLFRVTAYDAQFPAEALVPRVSAMVAALGLDARAEGRITFDLEDRPLKSPRPYCSVIAAPEEVVLVLRPVGGLSDYASFLHELGHALHFGYCDPQAPWEFRHLGDNAITESYAFLFDRLTVNPHWLHRVAGLADPLPLARLLVLREAMMLRKYAAQLLFELDLWTTSDPLPARAEWAQRLAAAVGVQQVAAGWLAGIDPMFYCARYLQGWLFEALLGQQLAAANGPEWFVQPATGQTLRQLFARGQDQPLRALFAELGEPGLTIEPILARFDREMATCWPTP
ncbi:MAG: hypothetical protein IT204_20645 [Fimbriimonadaceae bacterium]|nr:hypothetical protein [Fimbriimonadaceae bacterium]